MSRRVQRFFERLADEVAQKVAAQVNESLRAEMAELARMLRQQGDSADELAETFGRTLARLSEAVEDLQLRLDRLDSDVGGRSDRP